MSRISNHNKTKFLHKKFLHKKVPVEEKSVMAISFTQLNDPGISIDESANFQPGHNEKKKQHDNYRNLIE